MGSVTNYDSEPSLQVTLQKAKQPAHPVLPRQRKPRTAPHTRRERIPLASSLTGPGRAGTFTTLLGSSGSKYAGEVLSGRPHGTGQYWAPGTQLGQPLQLLYEGQFLRGVRHGQGTSYYHNRGETFSGQWVNGRRTGPGKLTYADGCVYDGMWCNDLKHGVGTMYGPGGSIFVGTFVRDKRQGLGVTFWGSRGKKHVAEYVDDTPVCGSMFDLTDDEVEPPSTQELRDAIAAARIKAAAEAMRGDGRAGTGAAVAPLMDDGSLAPQMPTLQLLQPSQVLAKEFIAVRQWRDKQQQQQQQQQQAKQPGPAATQPTSSTLSGNTMSLLRHAFILVAGGDDLAAHLLPHQLQELVVLAGLDPAAPAVVKLLQQLHQQMESSSRRRLYLEDLLHVITFFRETPLLVARQQQVEAATQEAAAFEAEQTGATDVEDGQRQQQQLGIQQYQQQGEDDEEVWREADEAAAGAAAAEAACEGEESDEHASPWGEATEQDMLAQHIAMHQPGADSTAGGDIVPEAS